MMNESNICTFAQSSKIYLDSELLCNLAVEGEGGTIFVNANLKITIAEGCRLAFKPTSYLC